MKLKSYYYDSMRKYLLFLCAVCVLFVEGRGQSLDDLCFEAGNGAVGFDDDTYCVVIQADGKKLVGGDFTSFNGVARNRIARLNSDGTLDVSFVVGLGFDNSVTSIVVQPDGKILVGGTFTSYNGIARKYIARLNSDGSLDFSYNAIGTGLNSYVTVITLQTDGKILVGGSFVTFNGTACGTLIRFNNDGTLDASFSDPVSRQVRCIAVQPDGKILVGGDFVYTPNIIRLNNDGSIDPSFVLPGTGLNLAVNAVAIQADGKIVVGGAFHSLNGSSQKFIVRLNSSGSQDLSFVIGTGFNYPVNNIVIQLDGKILVSGAFSIYNGAIEPSLIRLNTNGTKDQSFTIISSTGIAAMIGIALQSDGKVVVSGKFTSFDGITQNRIMRLHTNASLDYSFNISSGLNNDVLDMAIQPDGKILVVGPFIRYSATTQNRLARLNTDGSLDTSFIMGQGFNNVVNAVAVQPDGKILAGGYFGAYNGTSRFGIARLNSDGSIDSSFSIGVGFDQNVYCLAVQADGKVLVGGLFTSFNGVLRNHLVRLNTNGSLDSSFVIGTGLGVIGGTAYPIDIEVQADGKILVGGYFNYYSTTSRNYIMRLNSNGSPDLSFTPTGTGLNGIVQDVAIQSDGKILVGGSFSAYNGTPQNRIARLNADGSLDVSFVLTGTGIDWLVNTIALQNDGKIVLGGAFNNYNGTLQNKIARLHSNGSLDASFTTGTGFDATLNKIVIQPDQKILAAGLFRRYDGKGKNFIARLGESVPQINLQGNAINIISGQTSISTNDFTDFGTVAQCTGTAAHNYTIQNTGGVVVNISSITSSNPNFVVSSAPTVIAVGASATFTVTFDPTTTGTINSFITVNGGDCDKTLYNYRVQGVGSSVISIFPTVTATSGGLSDGAISLWVSGGNLPLSFTWSNGATTQNINNLAPGSYTVTITDAGGCATPFNTIFVSTTIGIEYLQLTNLAVNLYPNPTTDIIHLELENSGEIRLELIDLNGRVLQQQETTEQLIRIDMSEYPAGMYFIRLYKNKEQQSLKVVSRI